MKRLTVALVACLVLLVAAPVVTNVAAQNADKAGNTSEYSIEELKENGPRQGNSPPGVRMGADQFFWTVYWPANNPFADPGGTEGGNYLSPGHTVGRNAVYLRTWTYEDQQETVHVVYWQKGEKIVQQGNTTTTEPVAKNVTHVTHEVTFDRGRPTVKIPLRQHDQPYQVTMWIEGKSYARWRFQHKSIATTQAVDINSAGDYIASVIVDFLLWIVLGGFVVGGLTKKAIDRAGIGPQYGYAPWLLGLSLVTGLGSLLFYESVAELVVNAQYVLALYVVAVIGIVMLETYEQNVSTALFLRPRLEHAESPTGDEAFDVIAADGREEKIVRQPDGEVSVVTPGLLAFLARVFGSSARLENAEELRTRVPMEDSKWDEWFIVDPEAEQLLYYSAESWTTSFPAFSRANAGEYCTVAAGVLVGVAAIGTGTASGWAVGAVVAAGLAAWALEPVDGIAAVNPAPVHLRTAFGTMVKLTEDIDDAKRFDEVKAQLDSERVHKKREVDREVAEHDRTLVEEVLDPDGDVPAAVDDEPEATGPDPTDDEDDGTPSPLATDGGGGDD